MVVRALMEGLPSSFRFVLVSRDKPDDLQQDPLWGRMEAHISWQGGKEPPHPEFYQTRREVLGRLTAVHPDLVHLHSGGVYSWGNRWPGASWPADLSKQNIPCVWTNHLVVGLSEGYCGDRKPLWFKLAMLPLGYWGKSQQLRAVSAEICVSDHDAGKIRRWYFPFQPKVTRIYHSQLRENEIGFSTAPREKMILAVGHLAFRKGQQVLVEAFGRIAPHFPEWKLVLVGPESLDGCGSWIRDFCRREGLESRVTLTGARDDAREWMRRCSLFVQPSLQEALGLALQEAMACGCACVGTKAGGIPELILDGVNGRLVDAGVVDPLAGALQELIEKEDLRSRYGRAGVRHIEALGMSQRAMVEEHQKIYREALTSRSS